MFAKIIVSLHVMLLALGLEVQGFQMNMTQYYKMPPLYDFDDYDRCLQEFDQLSHYCFVRADVLADPNAEAWQAIQDVSQYHKHHFDHGHLYFGICVNWCHSQIDVLPRNEADALFAGILMNNTKVNIYLSLFKSEEANRHIFNRVVNQCVNLRLKKYDLSAESVIEYCSNNREDNQFDFWNFGFYTLLCLLSFLVILSSLFDLYLKQKCNDKLLKDRDHYTSNSGNLGIKICVGFSIARNWYRLNQLPSGKMGRELRFLDCFKFFSMFLVIFAHSNWVLYEGAISNPQDPERLLHTYAGTLLVAGSLITVTFFVIGGFLLSLNWLVVAKENKEMSTVEYLITFLKFNIFRYLRLTIPYGFVILWSGVYFDNAGGPMFRHIFEREQLSCRKNAWINLLYLNNYIRTNERCMLQGWYLASDTQSFVISIVILMLAHKFIRQRKLIFGAIIALFVVIPGLVTYTNKFCPIFLPTPQVQRDSFTEARQFNKFYVQFHMNFGCYFFGVLAALVYDHISSNELKLKDNKLFHITFYALIPAGILWLFSGHIFLQNYNEEDVRLWASIYASVQRNAWGLGLGAFIVGMSVKCGWILRKFCCLPIFRILGRLTYGAFLVHLLICRVVIATLREPIYFGTGTMFAFIVFTMAASYVVSFVLAILLELPISSYLKLLR
ncbi:nose resistant to fluoxetine protein 6 [Haematobia irritans]|uniref:nose resistant to fluoxetine protein 6 n=1 Tax=Haematobia irritans TaxID=7368 RepID=UPI003F5094B7